MAMTVLDVPIDGILMFKYERLTVYIPIHYSVCQCWGSG